MTAAASLVPSNTTSTVTNTPPSSFPKNRIVSHWTKSTPEEGIQVIFNAADAIHNGTNGVKMETHPSSIERPCQWQLKLSLAHPPVQQPLFPPSSAKTTRKLESPQSSCSVSSTLLILVLDRILQQSLSTGTGAYMEDPTGASRVRCDAYRTLYIYSPKLKRDICVHSIKRESWPQSIVFDSADVAENCGQEYHFQIWLAGSSPRQMDARTNVKLGQCQKLLWAMRRDIDTTNVIILIKDRKTAHEQQRVDVSRQKEAMDPRSPAYQAKDGASPRSHGEIKLGGAAGKNNGTGQTSGANCVQEPVFRAHKCILEATEFFSRMLNGNFKEGQADEDGVFRIELSSDMFDAEIMDTLLDYLYTREPITGKLGSGTQEDRPTVSPSQEPKIRHVISANVGLNLETIITENRSKSTIPDALRPRHNYRSHHQLPLHAPGLTLNHWGALYRAATHLEDKELQALSLEQIQVHLDPETTLEQVLSWGHQHEEVKSVMLEYLIKKRREVFGDDKRSKLRPYLWAEYDEQVETLVEITSQIARQ
ncbi:hypothetical protein BGX27_010337 [Mortierella sp. AM989]|nr:hypothetical protein BGX27_010337 [Mortierella sp. AM989]